MYHSKTTRLILTLLLTTLISAHFNLAWSDVSISGKEDLKDNEWVVSYATKNTVYASVNGKTAHGDRLIVRLVKGHCHIGNVITSDYSVTNNPNIKTLKGQLIDAVFLGKKMKIKVVSVLKFLAGHRILIDMGWIKLAEINKYFEGSSEVSLILKNDASTTITDYLDITSNAWSLEGLEGAVNRAMKICESL